MRPGGEPGSPRRTAGTPREGRPDVLVPGRLLRGASRAAHRHLAMFGYSMCSAFAGWPTRWELPRPRWESVDLEFHLAQAASYERCWACGGLLPHP